MRELNPTELESMNTLDLEDKVFLLSFELIAQHQLDVTRIKNKTIPNLRS